ncbi:ImmA/IrrE family metallo-endopeptidase [Effusibacillus pohliae]|uniref:ImmA/IrrE family metallo-endopeptidase n=1 Tax=Effusibacillus pohliae TaxID=232270 RepID=UPI0003671F76|nr:ImmA/IrrE family metallo-endopeptidase [Effusibacillus pohliae]
MFKELPVYRPCRLEQVVIDTYQRIGIIQPSDIDIDLIAEHFGLRLLKLDVHSKMIGTAIVIDSRLTPQEQREDFFHELTHAIRHAGNQLTMTELFRSMQEHEANRMPYYWLAPTFMLIQRIVPAMPLAQLVPQLAEAFAVTERFMRRRLELLQARLELLVVEKQAAVAMERRPRYGRDFNMTYTIGRTEYYCKDGRVVYKVRNYD